MPKQFKYDCMVRVCADDISSIKCFGRKVMEWNDVNNFMDLERALHKKCNQSSMVAAQRLISSMMRRCVGVCGV